MLRRSALLRPFFTILRRSREKTNGPKVLGLRRESCHNIGVGKLIHWNVTE